MLLECCSSGNTQKKVNAHHHLSPSSYFGCVCGAWNILTDRLTASDATLDAVQSVAAATVAVNAAASDCIAGAGHIQCFAYILYRKQSTDCHSTMTLGQRVQRTAEQ